MFLKDVKITRNIEIKPKNFLMSFEDKEIAKNAKMGQFIEIKSGGIENMLRIPISIHRVTADEITIVYKVVGNGTEAMSRMKQGDLISVIAPLGAGFPEDISEDKEIIMVAGGIGFGPFPYVMDKYKNWKLMYGVRDISELLMEYEVKRYEKQGKAFIATDNGSIGRKGYVTDILDEYLTENNKNKVIFCCGPDIMMRKVCAIAEKHNVESYISMEDYMGCGIGICVGCVRKIKNPEKPEGWEHKKVCKDGPVFKGEDIIWE